MCYNNPGAAIDYISLWDEQHARSLAQKERMGEGCGTIWSNQDFVDRFLRNLVFGDRSRIEGQIAGMQIPPGSSVLDIGAGPGTLAVPLALAGCQVTVVESSVLMVEAMGNYRRLVNAPRSVQFAVAGRISAWRRRGYMMLLSPHGLLLWVISSAVS